MDDRGTHRGASPAVRGAAPAREDGDGASCRGLRAAVRGAVRASGARQAHSAAAPDVAGAGASLPCVANRPRSGCRPRPRAAGRCHPDRSGAAARPASRRPHHSRGALAGNALVPCRSRAARRNPRFVSVA